MTRPEDDLNGHACRRTLDHLAALVRIWTPDAGVVYVNRPWRELTGTTLEENAGDGWLRCVHDDDRETLRAAFAIDTERQSPADYRLTDRDGQAVVVRDSPMPWTDDGSRAVMGVVHTISVRTIADAAPAKTMSKWAHELRGPLNAILGWADLLSAGDSAPEVVQRGLRAISTNARQQAQIIKRMTE